MNLQHTLAQLKWSQELFEALNTGKHLSPLQNPELWNALCGEQGENYRILFEHLGQKLVVQARGYAYFELDDVDHKASRPLALLYLLIFQQQADAGQDLHHFENWVLDGRFFQELRTKHQDILRSQNLDSEERWRATVNKAVQLGFWGVEGSHYVLLPPTWRFLDLFLELAEQISDQEADPETKGMDDAQDDDVEMEASAQDFEIEDLDAMDSEASDD
jgi:hypothetical protein